MAYAGHGGVPDWPIGTALKAVVRRRTAGSIPAPSARYELLRAAQLELDVVVHEVVDPLRVVGEVDEQPVQLGAYRLQVPVLQDLGAEDAQPAEQRGALAQDGAAAGGEPPVMRVLRLGDQL